MLLSIWLLSCIALQFPVMCCSAVVLELCLSLVIHCGISAAHWTWGLTGSGWIWSWVLLRIGVCLPGKFPGSAGNLRLLLSALMSKGTCWDPCWKQRTLKHGSTMKGSWEKLQMSRIIGAVLNLLKNSSNAGRLQLLCGNCTSAVGGVSWGTEMSL